MKWCKMKLIHKQLSSKIFHSKKLSEDDVVRLCMWAYFGAGGSVKSNRVKDFTHCGAGIECALREAYNHGKDSVKGKSCMK
jgi:hypothetical protein